MGDSGEPQHTTILVVDDNHANRLLARHTLEDEGYRVVEASNGTLGMIAFEQERPDCILLDVRMPEIDGFSVCERVRAHSFGADTPVIFLTALRDIETFDRAVGVGGDDFLTKPVRPGELIARVASALKLRSMRDELREHYKLLKDQRDALQRLQLQKERLMAFVVHDLKNPVGSIDLLAQFMLRDRSLPESARECATGIRSEAVQLTRMIMNLLDLSKGDEGKLSARRGEVMLGPLISDIFGELGIRAAGRDVSLTSELDVESVVGDEDLLRRLLANLVENAIRHTPPESSVRVTAARRNGGTELRVADAGPGVPVELRESIFDPFVQLQAENGHANPGGRGLGLTFCKLAVEAHGGRIWVEDASPGAVFCVSLPDG